MSLLGKKQYSRIDDVLAKASLSGLYYSKFLLLMFCLTVSNSINTSNYVFVAERSSYKCKDERFINNTCSRLSNYTDVCTEWVYDDPNSFVAEFQLSCQEWKWTLIGTVHNFGYGFGLLLIGPLSDKVGRKKMIVMSSFLGSVFGVARSVSVNYWVFAVLEFLEGLLGDAFSPAYILIMEIVPHEKRILAKMINSFGTSFGYVLLPLAAWLFPYWRHLLRVIYGPVALFLLYIFLIDESPRWLLSKGRKEEAIAVINKIAKHSQVNIGDIDLSNIRNDESHKNAFSKNLKHTFSSGIMIKRFIICLIWWISSSFVTYGLRINAVLLPGSKYINFGLFMVVDIIAKLVITYVLYKFRRKVPLMCSFVFAAVICFCQAFVPRDLVWLVVTLFLAGKMLSGAFFGTVYLYTTEIFPTYTRNSMHALCSSLGRIGSVIAPQTPLLITYWSGAPMFTFGFASLIAGLATMFAPDIASDALPDTVRQAEALGTKTDEEDPTLVPLSSKKPYD